MNTALFICDPPGSPPEPEEAPDMPPDPEPAPDKARCLVFAVQHTARDIPALLREARALRLSGYGPQALQLLSQIEILCTEYVLSDRLCSCGGQLDKAGRCLSCQGRQERLAAILARYIEEPIYR